MIRRWKGWWTRADIGEEIESHIEERVADLVDRGVPEDEARRQARREFGNPTLLTAKSREVWQWRFLEQFAQDLRYGLRMMRRNPVFTAMVVFSLALGIGANTAIFGLLDIISFRMLPVKNPEELRVLATRESGKNSARSSPSVSYPLYVMLRDQNRSIGPLAGTAGFRWKDKSAGSNNAWRAGQMVTGNYFDILGVRSAVGRTITPADDAVEAPGVAVLSYNFWLSAFRLDGDVIGKQVNVNGAWLTVVGITPREFFGTQVGSSPDIFVPIQLQPRVDPPNNLLRDPPRVSTTWVTPFGRVNEFVPEAQATADLSVIFDRYDFSRMSPSDQAAYKSKSHPASGSIVLLPGGKGLSRLREQFSAPLRLLMASVAVLLLMACVNIATLLLSRSDARRSEIGVRLAIGAGRSRLIRQLLTESLLLAFLSGVLSVLFAVWLSSGLVRMLPQSQIPLALEVVPNLRVLGFTFGISLLTGLLFGMAPALQAARTSLNDSLKHGTKSTLKLNPGKLFVLVEVALAIPLLVGAGLLIGTFQNLVTLDAGFNRENVLQVGINLEAARYGRAQWGAVYEQIVERIGAIPGVASASLVNRGLIEEGRTSSGPMHVPGYVFHEGESRNLPETYVDMDYFKAAGIPLRLGRFFKSGEGQGTQVAIVNETMVRQYLNGQTPIGKRYGFGDSGDVIEIVGVVADAKYNNLRQGPIPMAYYPWRQVMPARLNCVILRSQGDPLALAKSARQVLASIHPDLPQDIRTLSSQIDNSLAQERMLARLAGFFGLVSLLLACLGLYGVMAYGVATRTAEIGVRVALGAIPRDLAMMVLRETSLLALAGIALGIPIALALSRFVGSFLFGLKPNDPMILAEAAVAMAVVTAIAGYFPARRAANIDPLSALRHS